MRRVLLALLVLLALGAGWLLYRLNDRPSLEPYASLWLASSAGDAPGPRVTVTFLGETGVRGAGEMGLARFVRNSVRNAGLDRTEVMA